MTFSEQRQRIPMRGSRSDRHAFLDADALARWLPPYSFTRRVHPMDARVAIAGSVSIAMMIWQFSLRMVEKGACQV